MGCLSAQGKVNCNYLGTATPFKLMTYLPANGQDFTQRRKDAKKIEMVFVLVTVR